MASAATRCSAWRSIRPPTRASSRRKASPGRSARPRLLLEGPDKVDVALVALLKQTWERS